MRVRRFGVTVLEHLDPDDDAVPRLTRQRGQVAVDE
jgi:hypothetical protein